MVVLTLMLEPLGGKCDHWLLVLTVTKMPGLPLAPGVEEEEG